MPKATIILCRGNTRMDRIISNVTHGEFSHVAIKFPWGIVESLGVPETGCVLPGVRLSALDKYDNADVKLVEVELPDYVAAEAKAKSLIGKFYSYIGCVEGGVYNLFGVQLHPWINKGVNWIIQQILKLPVNISTGELTMDCSETVTRIIRAGGLDVLPGVDADCITPMDLDRAIG